MTVSDAGDFKPLDRRDNTLSDNLGWRQLLCGAGSDCVQRYRYHERCNDDCHNAIYSGPPSIEETCGRCQRGALGFDLGIAGISAQAADTPSNGTQYKAIGSQANPQRFKKPGIEPWVTGYA